MCICKNVEFGSYAVSIPVWYNTRKRVVDIDVCIVLEILELWGKGILTIESCCGHNKTAAYIAVDECCIDEIKELGYIEYPEKKGCFYAQKVLSVPQHETPKVGTNKQAKELNICPHCGVSVTNPEFSCCKLYEADHPEIFNG